MTIENPNYCIKPNISAVNFSESVAVSFEALSILGLGSSSNKEALTELLTSNYLKLINGQNRPGQPFVQLNLDNDYQLRAMLDKIDATEYNGHIYPRFLNWHKSQWTSSQNDIKRIIKRFGYHDKIDTNLGKLTINARLALSDGDGYMKPYLHYSNRPFDKENVNPNDDDLTTQQDAFTIEKISYESMNPEFNLTTMDVASYAMITLQKRIKGESMQNSLGTMIISSLGRKMILGGSAVSIVHTGANGRLGLGWSRGNPDDGTGFGISIGRNQ